MKWYMNAIAINVNSCIWLKVSDSGEYCSIFALPVNIREHQVSLKLRGQEYIADFWRMFGKQGV